MKEKFISTAELAKILGISRVAVFKKIKQGNIKAHKIGRNFVIDRDDVPELNEKLDENAKRIIQKAVKKTILEYGETLKLLGKE